MWHFYTALTHKHTHIVYKLVYLPLSKHYCKYGFGVGGAGDLIYTYIEMWVRYTQNRLVVFGYNANIFAYRMWINILCQLNPSLYGVTLFGIQTRRFRTHLVRVDFVEKINISVKSTLCVCMCMRAVSQWHRILTFSV